MTLTEKVILTVFILSIIIIAVILAFNGTKHYKP